MNSEFWTLNWTPPSSVGPQAPRVGVWAQAPEGWRGWSPSVCPLVLAFWRPPCGMFVFRSTFTISKRASTLS